MRSQLSFIGRVVCSLYVLLLFGHSVSIAAEKYDLKGTVKGIDDKVTVELAGTKKDDKTNRNGEFKLNNVLEGEYTLQVIADKKVIHEQSIKVDSDDDNLEINVGSSSATVDKTVISAAAANSVNQEVSSVPVPQTAEASGGASNDFILNELNFEIKKLTAEFKHLSREMDDLKALSKMWINPLTIYSKEIILKNGSTVFGKIVYQDDKSLKVIDMIPKKTNIMKEFGGGPVFGVNGIAIVAHGSSSPTAIANGISTVSWLTKKDYINQSIKELSSIRGSING